jgi:two-component system sensor histidine kinase RegB
MRLFFSWAELIYNFFFSTAISMRDEGQNENRIKIRWLIRLRWLAIFGLTISAGVGNRLGFLAVPLVPYVFLILSGLVFWNYVSSNYIIGKKHFITLADVAIQMFVDIGALTLLLLATGGIYNPLSSFLLVYSVLAALVLRGPYLGGILLLIVVSLGVIQSDPDVSHLDLRGSVTRPVIFLSYLMISLILVVLVRGLSRALNELSENVQALTKRKERLDRLRVAGAIAAGFSHEFSTPLYTARLRTDRLERTLVGESAAKLDANSLLSEAVAVREALEKCEDILKQMTSNGLKSRHLNLEVVAPLEAFSRWTEEYRAQYPERRLTLVTISQSPVMAELPLQPLKQSFFDLIDNAFEASVDQDVQVSIQFESGQIESGSLGSQFIVSITNTGAALAPVVIENWGEPFVTTKEDGNGLGLFNAITLLHAMGGELRASHHRGRTALKMSMPLIWNKGFKETVG